MHVHWAYDDDYMTWFYRVSHPIMTPNAPGRPLRPTNYEVLEAQDDHTESVTTVYRRVVGMGITDIET